MAGIIWQDTDDFIWQDTDDFIWQNPYFIIIAMYHYLYH